MEDNKYNASTYDINDLLDLLQLDEGDFTAENVNSKSKEYINRFKNVNNNWALFFADARDILLKKLKDDAIQPTLTPTTYNVPITQGIINPNLKNTTHTFINIDSQYRIDQTSSTNFSLDLSITLSKVLNLKLYSIQIPYSWYIIDDSYENTHMTVQLGNNLKEYIIKIQSGNYNFEQFTKALNDSFDAIGFSSSFSIVKYNSINGKITITLDSNVTDPSGNIISTPPTLLFNNADSLIPKKSTLGWLMGFREESVSSPNGIFTADGILDLIGTKYFILSIDDFNQNHINGTSVGITTTRQKSQTPNYFNNTMIDSSTGNILPEFQQSLTQAQQHTIYQTQQQDSKNQQQSPSVSDTFAIVPIKKPCVNSLLTEFSSVLQENKRTYFGPVDIYRLHVKLIDDKGRTVNLNGMDWSFIMVSENLYQY